MPAPFSRASSMPLHAPRTRRLQTLQASERAVLDIARAQAAPRGQGADDAAALECALQGCTNGADATHVAALDISKKGISSMHGLGRCTALRSLSAGFNSIADIQPWRCNQLRELRLPDNQLTSLEGVSGFCHLQARIASRASLL